MPQHVSGRFNFGASITEEGLNLVSAGLRVTKPELFQKSDDVLIKAPSGGQPGHTLRITAIAEEPIQFNLFPIPTTPTLPPDIFFVRVKLKFALTDSSLGLVTRIGVELEAVGRFIQPDNVGGQVRIRVEKRPDGSDYLDIINLVGDHPSIKLIKGAVDAGASVHAVYNTDDDSQLGRTFRAIVNYLINLFLKETLKRVVLEFPVPKLDKLLTLGALGPVPIKEIHAQNNALYLWMGEEEVFMPQPFPDVPVPSHHLRVGATEMGIERVIKASLPFPIEIKPDPSAHVQFRGEGLEVHRILFKLVPWLHPYPLPPGVPQLPGLNNIPVAVFIRGMLVMNVNFKVLGKQISFDIPIPFDSLTSYWGSFVPVLVVDPLTPATPEAMVVARAVPATGFADAWFAFIVTNYRGLFAAAVRSKLEELKDEVIGKDFCNVPILGWIVCGVITLGAKIIELFAWLSGAVLDIGMSSFFTVFVNDVVRLVRLFADAPSGKLYSLKQAELLEELGLTISQARIHVIDNGHGGELLLEASFDGTGVPIPPSPPFPTPIPPPVFPPAPLPPGSDMLPEYPPADFQPPYALPTPNLQPGTSDEFEVVIENELGVVVGTGRVRIEYDQLVDGWQIRQTVTMDGNARISVTTAKYAFDFSPVELSSAPSDDAGVSHMVTYLNNGYARVTIGIGSSPPDVSEVLLRGGVGQDFESLWIFRMGRAQLSLVTSQAFARLENSNPALYVNWARQIPVRLSIVGGTTTLPGSTTPTPIWQVTANDEENQIQFDCKQDGTGILKAVVKHDQVIVRMTRL